MWNPDITLSTWLRRHPTLSQYLPFKCICGPDTVNDVRPFVIKGWVGIEGKCNKCNRRELKGIPWGWSLDNIQVKHVVVDEMKKVCKEVYDE
jgi:hypothetical protein